MDKVLCRGGSFFGRGQIVHEFMVAARAEVLCALLRGNARPCIVLRDAVARHNAPDAHLFGRGNGNGHIADRAKAALDELDGVKPDELFIAHRHAPRALARDMCADDGVQLGELFLVAEDDEPDRVHIHRAVRAEDRAAEGFAQRFAQTFIALEHFMVDFVAVEDAGALPLKRVEQARLPRARAAGDADDRFPVIGRLRVEARGLFEPVPDGKAKAFTVRALCPYFADIRLVKRPQRVEDVLRLRALVAARAEGVDDVPVEEPRELVKADDAGLLPRV